MADFIWTESAGTTLAKKPRVLSTRFGDGYEERAPDGLNPVRQVWSLQFRAIDGDAAAEIDAFLSARFTGPQGMEAFNWVPLWSTAPIRVVCREWQMTADDDPRLRTVTATFEQEFVA